jgi:cation/acetate symporter
MSKVFSDLLKFITDFPSLLVHNRTLQLTMVVVAISVGITIWAARRTVNTVQFYAAGRTIGSWQNGLAISGDYLSAASFLGIAGIIAFNGYDGFLYSVGFLVAYLTVLFLLAEPLRNTGRFTMADVLAFRLAPAPVRSAAAISTLAVSGFYMIAQMVGAGALLQLLIPSITFTTAVIIVGVLMVGYVAFGGMVATTYVQIIKAVLLLAGTVLVSILVLAHFGFNVGSFFDSIAGVKGTAGGATGGKPLNFTQPGILYGSPKHFIVKVLGSNIDFGIGLGTAEIVSLALGLILGTAGLPHILMRFYTVPSARAARRSVGWAVAVIGGFYVLTTFLGFGAAVLVGKKAIGNSNLAAPKLAGFLGNQYGGQLGSELLVAFIAAVAFATILAVVAGLTLAASSAFAHDFWQSVIRGGHAREREQLWVARLTALVVGMIAIVLAINNEKANATVLVGVAFAIASSGNFPVLLLTLIWRRFNTWGAVAGLLGGTIFSIYLIAVGPGLVVPAKTGTAWPLTNPGLFSIPFGFLCAIVFTFIGDAVNPDREAVRKFAEIEVRSQTGIGSEGVSAAEAR